MSDLQPLRVISGWTIEWNTFMEIDPHKDDMSSFSGSSLLYAYNRNTNRAISLEWRPEEDYDGEFILRVINLVELYNSNTEDFELVGDWENSHYEFCSRDRLKVVSEIERLMLQLLPYKDPRIIKSRGVVDEVADPLRLELEKNSANNSLTAKIIESKNKVIQNLLIDAKSVRKTDLEHLVKSGVTKGVKNKAAQKLNSKTFRKKNNYET